MSEFTPENSTLSVGMEETKKVLSFVISLGKAIESAEADGKMTLTDITYFLPVILSAGPAIAGLKEMQIELKAATEAEAQDLKDWVKTQVPTITSDEHVNQFIQGAFAIVVDIWLVVRDFFFKNLIASGGINGNAPAANDASSSLPAGLDIIQGNQA